MSKMHKVHQWLMILKLLFLFSSTANSETTQVRDALVQFMAKLSPENGENWGWNTTSDPCINTWKGVTCYTNSATVKKIVLDELNLTGVLDATSLCTTTALTVLSLNSNGIIGSLSDDISNCTRLTHVYLHGNSFWGNLPVSLSRLSNLKRLDVSDNGFSGDIPSDVSRISGLLTFLAENNQFTGNVPKLDFSNLEEFNVSNNNLTGPIPDFVGRFNATSFLGNRGLCGKPLSNSCPPPPSPPAMGKKGKKDYFIYSGYALIGLIVVGLVSLKLIKKGGSKEKKSNGFKTDGKKDTVSSSSSESKGADVANRSEFSITSAESGRNSSSLVVLQAIEGLRFEDLLRSPAELMGRGRRGSLYKVTINEGVSLAVKRIRDWEISRDDFKKRMERIDQVRHPNVMPVVAFYCSRQEKLLVYQFQHNGSLFALLHGSQNGQSFDWESRLNVAAKISEALAFMQEGLNAHGIAHGNLKSSNILLNDEMEPYISEYGLSESENQDRSFLDSLQSENNHIIINGYQADIYSFGVILLELLTGKLVQNNGFELARWVNSAIREEWTVEIFDKALVSEGASEERMVGLLQVALKCINGARPSMREVAVMINSIKENEDKSIASDISSTS